MQLKYCQKLDFEADPNDKLKPLKKIDFNINYIKSSFF